MFIDDNWIVDNCHNNCIVHHICDDDNNLICHTLCEWSQSVNWCDDARNVRWITHNAKIHCVVCIQYDIVRCDVCVWCISLLLYVNVTKMTNTNVHNVELTTYIHFDRDVTFVTLWSRSIVITNDVFDAFHCVLCAWWHDCHHCCITRYLTHETRWCFMR